MNIFAKSPPIANLRPVNSHLIRHITPMQENYIIAENISTHGIEEILRDLANLYSDITYADGIQLYQKKDDSTSFLICFTNPPDFDRFSYFVNYIHYPENGKSTTVKGFYQVTDIDIKGEFKIGNWVLVFVSKMDEDYDNVLVVNENHEHFLIDFGGKITKLIGIEESFKLPRIKKEDYNHIINISPKPKPKTNPQENQLKPWWKFW